MSELDIKALEANFEGWWKERAPELPKSDAFERYAIELIFRDLDPSDDEMASGWTGGGDDGGIDGIYFLVNRRFMPDEYKLPEDVSSVELHLVQAKNETGFGETPIEKMQLFVDDLLTYSKPVSSLTYYNQKVRDRIENIRSMYEAIIGRPHSLSVIFWYATKSDQDPNPKVKQRVENLKQRVVAHVSSAKPVVNFLNARALTAAFRSPPSKTAVLNIVQHMMCHDGSVVCLARLNDFATFLTDKDGSLREYILEPNVRDYAGKYNPVNRDIRSAIESSDIPEFWWLNNGITILADKCGVAAGKAEIDSPELVNGLQTSHELFNYFSEHKKADIRNVLVRIILPPDEQMRRKITKATNNQTPVNPLSLRATEDIHFDIEELLRLYGVFYDRRKGEYRRLRKPISQIVSIKELAQAVIAVVLQKPDDARARPMSILGTDNGYQSVFDVNAKREIFLSSILLDRKVVAYLASREDLTRDAKNDIRFYMDTWLASRLSNKKRPSKADIAALSESVKQALPKDALDVCCDEIFSIYVKHGGSANAAKGTEMAASLMAKLEEMYA
jgi:hypothetical protein